MKVEYVVGRKPFSRHNIIWAEKHSMNGGKFPKSHPCADNKVPLTFEQNPTQGGSDGLSRFRDLGYCASCFPEGDGVAFDPPDGKTPAQVAADIAKCFGWDVEIVGEF